MRKFLHALALAALCGVATFPLPAAARFLQTDPVGYQDDFDLYTYVGNDPANKVDPSGKTDPGNSCIGDWCAGPLGVW